MSEMLIRYAAPKSNEAGVEHGCETQSIPTSPGGGAGSAGSPEVASETTQSSAGNPEAVTARVRVVTRAAKRRARKSKFNKTAHDEKEVNLESVSDEFKRLSNIGVSDSQENVCTDNESVEVDGSDSSEDRMSSNLPMTVLPMQVAGA